MPTCWKPSSRPQSLIAALRALRGRCGVAFGRSVVAAVSIMRGMPAHPCRALHRRAGPRPRPPRHRRVRHPRLRADDPRRPRDAGRAARRVAAARSVAVLCGPATTAATATWSRGWRGRRACASRSSRSMIRGDCAATRAGACGISSQPAGTAGRGMRRALGVDVIVDALFGIGLTRERRRRGRGMIAAAMPRGRPMVAVDIPSGLHADTGACSACAARAR